MNENVQQECHLEDYWCEPSDKEARTEVGVLEMNMRDAAKIG